MSQINFLDVKHMNNNMRFQLSVEFKDLVVKFGAENLKIAPQFAEYMARLNDVDTALKKITKSVYTAQLQACDVERDDACYGMADINKVVLFRHHDPAARALPNLLMRSKC